MNDSSGPSSSPLLRSLLLLLVGFVLGIFVGTRIGNRGAGAAPESGKLTIPKGQAAVGFLDMVNGQPVIRVQQDGEVKLSGWAGCATPDSPIVRLDIHVDKQVTAVVESFFVRADVAQAYDRADLGQSGWHASFPARGLSAGAHQLGARVICRKGQSGELPPFRLEVRQ